MSSKVNIRVLHKKHVPLTALLSVKCLFGARTGETCPWYTAHPPFFPLPTQHFKLGPVGNLFVARKLCPPISSTYHIAKKAVQQESNYSFSTVTLLYLYYYTMLQPLLFYLHYYTMSFTVPVLLPLLHNATASFSVTFLPLLLHHATASLSPSIIYPHSTNYPATTLPVFLFHILHHCFRARCVKPVLTSDGKRPPPLHPPTPFFLSHFTSPLGFNVCVWAICPCLESTPGLKLS